VKVHTRGPTPMTPSPDTAAARNIIPGEMPTHPGGPTPPATSGEPNSVFDNRISFTHTLTRDGDITRANERRRLWTDNPA
jgi:hypothetical protein